MTATTTAVAARVPELLRDRPFRHYWTGQSISLFGDRISEIAIPLLAVLTLHADALQMGWLTAVGLLPSLLFSLHAGVWADRRGHRRRMMIAADLGRAALLATLPVGYALDLLALPQLYAVAFAVGALSVLFEVCNAALFVSLVPTRHYVQGNSLVNGSRAMSFVSGTSVGGVLVQILTAPFASSWTPCRISSPPASSPESRPLSHLPPDGHAAICGLVSATSSGHRSCGPTPSPP
jgi:MFS family permease